MAQPTLELPNPPQDWLDLPPDDTSPAMPDDAVLFGGGLLSGLPMPAPWSLANSSINAFVPPDVMKTIDFDGTGAPDTPPWLNNAGAVQPQPPQPDGGGFYTGLTPYQPDPSPPNQTQSAPNSPLTVWPVPDHAQLNTRDPQRGQGDGAFGSIRDHGQGWHTGIDITAAVGTPVVAAGDGTVANIQPNPSTTYGNQVVIQHTDGFNTQYGHLSRIDAAPGTAVHAGDVIGLSGRSGNVPPGADAHLHFEVRRGNIRPHSTGGQVVDPMQYLPETP